MRKAVAEKYRDIVKPEPGKTKIAIRLDNAVIEYFRNLVDKSGWRELSELDQRCAARTPPEDSPWAHLTVMRSRVRIAVCISNDGYEASLEVGKFYRVVADPGAEERPPRDSRRARRAL